MEKLLLKAPDYPLRGSIQLPGSKSISNRVLIMRALANADTTIHNLSISDDTVILNKLLNQQGSEYNAGHAGTSYRFSTAFFAVRDGEQILTGSERMLQRPIGPLVEALRSIGADITYLAKEDYPPLKIGPFKHQINQEVEIDSSMSSQYISALCMIAPILPLGLKIILKGRTVSRPYLDMTLTLMRQFGVEVAEERDIISIAPQAYQFTDFTVESDWSAASYYYSLVSISKGSQIELSTLYKDSLQGDSDIAMLAMPFGVSSNFNDGVVTLKPTDSFNDRIDIDCLKVPDIAQTLAVMAAMKGIHLTLRNLNTLIIKETDRIKALQNELGKCKVEFECVEAYDYVVKGVVKRADRKLQFKTYDDHRMAMAFAPMALTNDIIIEDPKVVSKSYPGFWQDLESLGFILEWMK
ncbi:MAG: 3-phosphoshikimate 1-carboxyvinyltransferase [Saprospiraceae bacterium]|nr:3-phosphoshikimate 1-carboxyvinyltransferase [Saprospiraceae bacterium]